MPFPGLESLPHGHGTDEHPETECQQHRRIQLPAGQTERGGKEQETTLHTALAPHDWSKEINHISGAMLLDLTATQLCFLLLHTN
jgi:hypothetical protein